MQKKLVLVDGSSYLFRAYHALPPLTNAAGEPTGAIYGVINMLRKLQQQYHDCYFAVIFDAKGKNFRHELFPDYKANRGEMPEDLVPQVQPIHDVVTALGYPLLMQKGVEADDVIGTLAQAAAALNFDVIISTGDKDMAQLVNERIMLVNTMSGAWLDEAGVEAKFAVKPRQIIDYLALVGDQVDNIPGVPKVGPKTAAKWLASYQTLAGVIEHADEIKGKVGDNLRQHLSQLPLARQLVTIRCDVELGVEVEALRYRPADVTQLRELYQRYEFKNWLQELDEMGATVAVKTTPQAAHHQMVQSQAQLQLWLDKVARADCFVFDCETTSLQIAEAELVGLSLAVSADEAAYIPLAHSYPGAPAQLEREQVLTQLKPYWLDRSKAKLAHNLKYDLNILANYDIELQGPLHDSMLASYVCNAAANRHDLDTLATKYLGRETTKFTDVAGKGAKQVTFDQVTVEVATPYACEDAEVCWRLQQQFMPQVNAVGALNKVYHEVEMPLVPVLAKMERHGVQLDTAELSAQSTSLEQRLQQLQESIYSMAGEEFNIDSPKQLQTILFTKLALPVLSKTPKGQPSTSESVLSDLALDYELPAHLLEYRSLHKLKSTYTDKLPLQICSRTGRIHTSFHQAVTATGRLSSSDPNLQNIPIRRAEGRQIRRAFVVPAGFKMVALDYSQIELRIMAHLSQDQTLLAAFADDQDIHQITASEVFGVNRVDVTPEQRRSAKAINFGLIYGMSAFGLAKQLAISRDSAQHYINRYFARYPGVKDYMDRTRAQAAQQGYVETLLGRRLYLPDIKAKAFNRRQAAERTAINAPMQGTAADIIKLAMIRIDAWLAQHLAAAKMLIQVHDELVFEVPEAQVEEMLTQVTKLMSDALPLAVPLQVSAGVGRNWEEAH